MKLYTQRNEWWPVHEPADADKADKVFEVTPEFHARYLAAFKEFDVVSDMLSELG